MNTNIETLKPERLWHYFAEICKIPHPSNHEEKIRKYVIETVKGMGLTVKEDAAHNLYIRKPATKGMEDRKGIVLQAHVDMVPQKNNDTKFDFTKDSIQPRIDGDWVRATGTTLGADNGIGVAAMLAVLEDKALQHGPLEALFTATEETGMDGAFGLKKGVLQGDILLNLDTEEDGELCVGCAGGLDANITFKYTAEPAGKGTPVQLTVKGLRGGHSGTEINTGRANANKLLFRFLNEHLKEASLCSVDGGSLRNAIPREASAVLMVKSRAVDDLKKAVKAYEKVIKSEYDGIEDTISIKLTELKDKPATMIPADVTLNLVRAILGCPNGVQSMSHSMNDLVQTSTNLARVVSDAKTIKIQCLMRSSVNTEKDALGEAMTAVFAMAGAKTELSGGYGGWKPNMDSPILATMKASHKELYGKEPHVVAVHAGLECGIIGANYPKMDMISFGPTIRFAHSPDECVEIKAVAKFWDYLLHTLKNAPKRTEK